MIVKPSLVNLLHLQAYLFIALADIDDNATEDEFDLLIRKIKERVSPNPDTATQIMNEAFEWYLEARTAETIPDQINEHQELLEELDEKEKRTMLRDLEEIAAVDGAINDAEKRFLQAMAVMVELG